MTTFFVASILFIGGIIYFALARISSRRKTAEQKLNSSTTKVNLIIGDAPPPNAVVFGSGYLRIPDMVSKGFVMNIISIIILTLFVYFVLPILWDLTVEGFPEVFR